MRDQQVTTDYHLDHLAGPMAWANLFVLVFMYYLYVLIV